MFTDAKARRYQATPENAVVLCPTDQPCDARQSQ
jgi:hypothetical protein